MPRVPCLVIEGVEADVWNQPLAKRRQTIGRSRSCDIRIAHSSISRVHAEIRWENNAFVLRDLESRNGTFHNGKQIKEARFEVGDALQLARVNLLVIFRQVRRETAARLESTTHNYKIPADASDELLNLIDLTNQFALSRAQSRVLRLLLEGLSEKEVASRLHISVHTVHSHAKNIYRVIGVHSRAELLARYWSSPTPARKAERGKTKPPARRSKSSTSGKRH